MIDNFTREALVVDVDFSMPARKVTAVVTGPAEVSHGRQGEVIGAVLGRWRPAIASGLKHGG